MTRSGRGAGHGHEVADGYVPGHGDPSYDVLHYDLDIDYRVEGNQLAGRVMYLTYGGNTYQLLGYTLAARYGSYANAMAGSMQSFGQLSDPAALNKQPVHLQLVRLPRAMTIEEFYRQYPSPVRLELIAAINGVTAGQTMPAGYLAKRVQ